MYKTLTCFTLSMLLLVSKQAHADTYPSEDLILEPQPARFSICYHGTCAETMEISLAPAQWQRIRDVFATAESGQAEREQIKRAIALMENMVGEISGTLIDRAGTFAHLGEQGQLDCIDESVNTTFYLQMMINDGLIRGHTVEDRAHRGFFIFGWPHSTAVIRDRQSRELYAVDSWFEDNGKPPHIIPLQQWSNGWEPAHF